MPTNYVYFMPKYFGNVMKRNINGEDTIYLKNTLLQYDEIDGVYYLLGEKEGILIDFGYKFVHNENNDSENMELNKYCFKTDVPDIDGQLYIDKNSLVEVKNGKKSR